MSLGIARKKNCLKIYSKGGKIIQRYLDEITHNDRIRTIKILCKLFDVESQIVLRLCWIIAVIIFEELAYGNSWSTSMASRFNVKNNLVSKKEWNSFVYSF